MIPFVVALLAKLTLILAGGLIATAILRSASPSLRHLVLLATLACGLTLPLAMLIAPSLEVAILPQFTANLLNAGTSTVATDAAQNGGSIERTAPRSSEPTAIVPSTSGSAAPYVAAANSPASADDSSKRSNLALPLLWAFGFVLILAWLAIGRFRLRRIAREAWPLGDDWQRILDEGRHEAGVTRSVRLLASTVVSTPLTWGSISPVILLPENAIDWPEEHRRVVLRHELAHVARRDSLAQLVAGFVCALYWFHPMVWMSERHLRAECERACDDRVVSLGTAPTDYASHLLEVARAARAFGAPGFLSVAMARPSQLEGRLLAVLNESRRRATVSRGARAVAVVMAALVMLPLAAFRPVAKDAQRKGVRVARVWRPTQSADTTFQLSVPVKSGGTLDLDLKTGGAVTITSWDRNEVMVRAALGGRDWRDTRVTLKPSDGDATLESNFVRSSNNQSTSHNFTIQIPRNFNVRIKSAGGAISLADVAGRFSGSTGGGE